MLIGPFSRFLSYQRPVTFPSIATTSRVLHRSYPNCREFSRRRRLSPRLSGLVVRDLLFDTCHRGLFRYPAYPILISAILAPSLDRVSRWILCL
ncbi:hypothetical protein BDW60DRAFT_188266 [Aspergillus nidulans var. acristatus]